MNDRFELSGLALVLLAALGMSAPVGAADANSTTSATESTSTLSRGQSNVIGKTADTYTPFAGSRTNAESLATGLRTGGEITLTGTGANGQTTTTNFAPPTKPMGYGNVNKALALSSQQLAAAGVAQPTPEQIQTSMMGGTITNDAGQQVELQGVLQMRADGMGWGQIAHELGVQPGLGYRPAHTASGVTTAASTTGAGVVSAKGRQTGAPSAGHGKHSGTTTAASPRSGSGIVTAGGSSGPALSKGSSQVTKGPTTAAGSAGVVSAAGQGHGAVSTTAGAGSGSRAGGAGLAKSQAK